MLRLIPTSFSTAFAVYLAVGTAQAQGGKEFLQWLKDYSPTGYFIINDYETRANKPGDHKQWLDVDATAPMPSVAVHETCHMRDGLNSKNGFESIHVGGGKDYSIKKDFQPFNSKEIMADIPDSLVNFQTDVYISGEAGTNAYSMVGGLIGIMGEWNAYITGLQSGVEVSVAIKEKLNTKKNWDDLANDMTTSVWSNAEFRYFCLRYILWARKRHPATFNTITTGNNWKQAYTHLVVYAEPTLLAWKAVLEAQGMDTRTRHGFDWHWKFWNEIQKPEYKEIEVLMLLPTTGLARNPAPRSALRLSWAATGRFDLQGRRLDPRQVAGMGTPVLSIAREGTP